MRGRRGVLSDYAAAVRGTLAMRRSRGQARIELAFAGAAMVVAFVGFYTVFVQSEKAESADEARSALGLAVGGDPTDEGGLMIGEGDGFVVTEGEDGSPGAGSDAAGIDGAGPGAAAGSVTTGPGGVPVGTPGAGLLPSEGASGEGPPGSTGEGGGEGEGGTETSLPPTSTTEPGTSTSTSTPTSDPEEPGTTPTTAPPANGGIVEAVLDLLGL